MPGSSSPTHPSGSDGIGLVPSTAKSGGTALPADISPPPASGSNQPSAPGESDRQDDYGLPGPARPANGTGPDAGPRQPDGRSSAPQPDGDTGAPRPDGDNGEPATPRLPGLPRLFFADPPAPGQSAANQAAPQATASQPTSSQSAAPQPEAPQQEAPQQQAPQQAGLRHPPDQQSALDHPQQPWGQPPADTQSGRPGFGQPPPGQQPSQAQPARQPPAPGQPRQLRQARPQPTRAPDKELRQRAIASLVLGALALVALLGLSGDLRRGVYLLLFSTVIGIGACVIGITALRKARKTGTFRPRGAVGGIILGALAALVSIPIIVTYLAYPTQVTKYVNCLSQAQTSSAQKACMNQFYKAIHLGSSASAPVREHAPRHP